MELTDRQTHRHAIMLQGADWPWRPRLGNNRVVLSLRLWRLRSLTVYRSVLLVTCIWRYTCGWKQNVFLTFLHTHVCTWYLQNGSDHAVVASYSGLYEECDVEHINVFGLVFYTRQLVLCSEFWTLREKCTIMRSSSSDVVCRNYKTMCVLCHRRPFYERAMCKVIRTLGRCFQHAWFCPGGLWRDVDMFDITFFI